MVEVLYCSMDCRSFDLCDGTITSLWYGVEHKSGFEEKRRKESRMRWAMAKSILERVRAWTAKPLCTCVIILMSRGRVGSVQVV